MLTSTTILLSPKIVSYESDRSSAIKGMLNGLSQLHVAGVNTNVNFLSNLLQHDSFLNDSIDVRFVETRLDELTQVCEHLPNEIAAIAALFLHSTLRADHNKLEKAGTRRSVLSVEIFNRLATQFDSGNYRII